LLRLENIADAIDGATATKVNVMELAAIFFEAKNGKIGANFDITEKSLSTNMNLEDMVARKIKWKTKDEFDGPSIDYSEPDTGFTILEPQRIRVF